MFVFNADPDEALLRGLLRTYSTLALSSTHYLHFTSLANCMMQLLANNRHSHYPAIYSFLQSVFSSSCSDQSVLSSSCSDQSVFSSPCSDQYRLAWACNLLSQLIYKAQNHPIYLEIIQWAATTFFVRDNLLGLLGALLEQYWQISLTNMKMDMKMDNKMDMKMDNKNKNNTPNNPNMNMNWHIKWPISKEEGLPPMGLLSKELLLSLLKVYSNLLVLNRHMQWANSPQISTRYTLFSTAIIDSLYILVPSSSLVAPTTPYEDYLA